MSEDFLIIAQQSSLTTMGRGDKKSKKGKIFKGSFGNTRKKASAKAKTQTAAKATSTTASEAAKPKRTTKKKAEA